MRWRTSRRSENVEDMRGARMRGPAVGGGIGVVVLALVAMYFGVDPSVVLQGLNQQSTQVEVENGPVESSPHEEERKDFVAAVLGDTEDTWRELFRAGGGDYQEPKLVLFREAIPSACGTGQAAMGPFYCPGDQKVYIDLSFFDELKNRFGASGDFAQAYVIAHEVGHHVQTLLGISAKVNESRSRLPAAQVNQLSVKMELQADCLAGVWANHADRSRQLLETGDVESALGAASAIGDDRLQQQTQGRVVPESFTHGTSEQRVRWFKRGLQDGDVNGCDTFSATAL